MVAVKAAQAEAFLSNLKSPTVAWLLYGSDAGLVSERAASLAERLARNESPPGEIVRMDDSDLEHDPDRFSVELLMVPMFGGRKIVRATAGRRLNAALLKPILSEPALPAFLIVEAGNLRPDDSLRQMFERPPHAAAIACFADDTRDLDAVVRQVLEAHSLEIKPDARELLISKLGADRVLSRGEVEKLALFCMGGDEITAEDVEAIVGDASELTMDRIVSAAALGNGIRATLELDRTLSAGESAQTVISALQRHFQRLHRFRLAIEAGQSTEDVLKQTRPPLHFKARDAIAAELRLWTVPLLAAALSDISAAQKAARLTTVLESQIAERLIMKIAERARSRARAGASARR